MRRHRADDDARKGHPGFTPTDPPRREILGVQLPPLPKSPPAPVIHDQTQEPAQEKTKQAGRISTLQHPWAGSMVALVVALGGGQGIRALTDNGVSEQRFIALHERVSRIERTHRGVREYLTRARQEDIDRNSIIVGVLCRLNDGEEFARGVDCDEITAWDTPPNGQTKPVRARAVYPNPNHSRLPLPETD